MDAEAPKKSFGSSLNDFYRRFLPEEIVNLSFDEKSAQCTNCNMAQPEAGSKYKPDLKCCTFVPMVPNFLLGGFKDEIVVELLQSKKVWLLPLGMCPTIEYREQFRSNTLGFGQNKDLLCPLFDTEGLGCSVWGYRPSECVTYFCVSSYGEEGLKFWKSFNEFLHHVESSLAQMFLANQGLGSDWLNRQMTIFMPAFAEKLDFIDIKRLWEELPGPQEFFSRARHWAQKQNLVDLAKSSPALNQKYQTLLQQVRSLKGI